MNCGSKSGRVHSKRTYRFRTRSELKLSSKRLSWKVRICQGKLDEISVLSTTLTLWHRTPLVDKVSSGFLAWEPNLKGYMPPGKESRLDGVWEEGSLPALQAVRKVLRDPGYLRNCLDLWAQESDTRGAMSTDLNLRYVI